MVAVIDLNHDQKPEVFVNCYNYHWHGQTGYEFIFSKNRTGEYSLILNERGSAELLTTAASGYPDILIGGPGMTAPTFRWNGTKYQFYKKVPFGEHTAPKMIPFKDYSRK